MFLSKRKNGFWYVFYESTKGRRTCISTKTKIKKEAFKFLSRLEIEIENRKQLGVISISLNEFGFQYLKYSESVHRPKTTKILKTIFNQLNSSLGNLELSEISTKDLKVFLLEKLSVSTYTAQKYLAYIRSAFNKAVRDKYLISNPCSQIENFRIPEKQPLFFNEVEFNKLINEIDNKDLRDLIVFAVNTGLRQMEILTLEWNQINFKNNLLILDNRNHLTKSKKIRTIPLNIKSLQILTERERKKVSELIFTFNGFPIKQDFISKTFKKFVKNAKLNNQLNFHSLRHTFASWLVQKGVSIYEVSKLLGHSDIKVTEIYSHLRVEDLRNSVNLLSN